MRGVELGTDARDLGWCLVSCFVAFTIFYPADHMGEGRTLQRGMLCDASWRESTQCDVLSDSAGSEGPQRVPYCKNLCPAASAGSPVGDIRTTLGRIAIMSENGRKKDIWDKLEVAGKLAIPIVLALATYILSVSQSRIVEAANNDRSDRAEFMVLPH